MNHRWVFVGFVAACTVNCESGQVEGSSTAAGERTNDIPDVLGDGVEVAYEDFVLLQNAQTCDYFLRCAGRLGRIFPDSATCLDFFNGFALAGFSSPPNAPLDAVRARQCLTSMAATSCDAPTDELLAGCPDLVRRSIPDGECCATSDEGGGCIEGSYCELEPRSSGVCQSLAGLGESCASTECAPDLTCEFDVCVRRPGLGEACDRFSDQCGDDAACIGSPEATCQPLKGVGEPCESALECESQSCDGTCQAETEAPGLGESCEFVCDLQLFNGPACVVDANGAGTCLELRSAVGEPCSDDLNIEPRCNPFFGLTCDPETSLCVRLPSLGESCTRGCQPGGTTFCEIAPGEETGVCRSRLPTGAACELERSFDELNPCQPGLFCIEETCQTFQPLISCSEPSSG